VKHNCKMAVFGLGAALASLGGLRSSGAAATSIANDESAVVDGWNITAPVGVSLMVTASGSEIFIQKTADFTELNQGLQVAFQPVAGAGSAATSIDFTNETIEDNTEHAFGGIAFILMNAGSPNATFTSEFAPPVGAGYDYGLGILNSTGDILSYNGAQQTGQSSFWGSSAPGDNLLISALAGSDFSFKELIDSGNGGVVGGGGPPPGTVSLPAAAWQSIAGLGGLALIGVARSIKRRII